MIRRPHALLLVLLAACGGGGELREATERRRAEAATTPATSAPADSAAEYRVPAFVDRAAPAVAPAADTAPAGWTTSPVGGQRETGRTHTLRAMRVGLNPGFDRLVLDFGADPVPPHRVEYTATGAHQCGSGEAVPLPGTATLRVVLFGTRAHDDAGRPTVARRDLRPSTPHIRAASMVCDFEGQVEVALGVQERRPFRVLVVPSPNRLTVDVRQ